MRNIQTTNHQEENQIMNVEITLNGAASDEGFAIVGKSGSELSVKTTDGSSGRVQLSAEGAGADAVTLTPSEIDVSGDPVSVKLEASSASDAQNDHTIGVVESGNVIAKLNYTVIDSPRIQFDGRYQDRLATDPDPFDSPFGARSSFGMYSVEGAEPPLDRIVRYQDPVALRVFAPPVEVTVKSVIGNLGDGSEVAFKTGDCVIGLPAALGPNCKFDSRDGAFAPTGDEPISDFTFSIGDVFSGGTEPAVERAPGAPHPNRAPYADGFLRMDSASPLKPADFGYPDPSWMERSKRIPAEKIQQLEAQVPTDEKETLIRDRRLREHRTNLGGIEFPIAMLEEYTGAIHLDIAIDPKGSQTLAALQSSSEIPWRGDFFDFDSDVQCGTTWGTLG